MMLDIFKDDAFSVVSLIGVLQDLTFKPGFLGSSGLFEESSVSTTTVAVERDGDYLKLIPPTPRGAPGTTMPRTSRSMLAIIVPHHEINDSVMAEEVQNVRPLGAESGLETVQALVAKRLLRNGQSLEVTHEYSRIGALKGVITYADGSILDLYKTFNVQEAAGQSFNLATAQNGLLRKTCAAVIRRMSSILGGVPFSGVSAACGDNFFDALIMNPEVRKTYEGWQAAQEQRTAYITASGGARGNWGAFHFGGIDWYNYRGSVNGTAFIDSDKCHLYPTGVPGLFQTVFAPADYMETVNTMGLPKYAKQFPMPNDKGVQLDVQTNPLHFCSRPEVLIEGSIG